MTITTTRIFRGGEYLIANVSKEDVFTPEDFNSEQQQFAEMVEQFTQNEVVPHADRLEHQDFDLMVSLLKKAGELGLMLIDGPQGYGGLELDKATSMLVTEKIAAYSGYLIAFSGHTGIGTLPLVYFGSDAQKEKYLGKLLTGQWIGAYCLTEPNSGSDALGAKATAKLSADGKYYILNGTKQFITNGCFADLFTVFAKIDGKHFTAFLVERTFEGVTTGPEEKKLGIKGSSTTPVILEDVKVPVENLLGELGKGHKIAFNVLNIGRFKLGAGIVGSAKTAYLEGVKYANLRKQFGVTIGSFGAIKEKIADATTAIFASESLIYRLAGMLDRRLALIPKDISNYYEVYLRGIEEYALECSIAKVYCSEALDFVVDEVLQIHGGYGYVQEYPAERFYRDSRINRIFEGTNEINRILIPSILLKRAKTGEFPLEQEIEKAFEAIVKQSFEEPDRSDLLGEQMALLKNLKSSFLLVLGATVRKFGEKIKDEQEVLMALAEMAIQIFALESVVIRADKMCERNSTDRKKELALEAVKILSFQAGEAVGRAARKVAFSACDGRNLQMILDGITSLTRYNASGLISAKRRLADAVLASERYVF
jgi:alkylation response protein AidB-like acyl-CoA dehydrogenase